MAVKIDAVEAGSLCEKKRIRAGDLLLSINGHPIADVLDYRFFLTEARLTLEIQRADGKRRRVKLRKAEYEDIGLCFETYLMDRQQHCRNNCIFCFIDQLPDGMRESLYFKDDDARLSFLFGNYITLTNLTDEDVTRIIRMHISPINISVHTTNPDLRVRMMRNRFAGESLRHLYRLAQAGIAVNCQIVLCPDINDGAELDRTLTELSALYPAVESIACVPVGLTDHREGLYPLKPYTKETAGAVIDRLDAFSERFAAAHGARIAYPADEFFLKAERPIPERDYYGGFNQLENGVGMLSLMRGEFLDALAAQNAPMRHRRVSVATGVAAADFLRALIDEAAKKWHTLECTVYPIQNDFFGRQITVAGLVTGGDLIAQLRGKPLGEELLLSRSMLKFDEAVFLDDVTLGEVEAALGVRVRAVADDGAELLRCLLNA